MIKEMTKLEQLRQKCKEAVEREFFFLNGNIPNHRRMKENITDALLQYEVDRLTVGI